MARAERSFSFSPRRWANQALESFLAWLPEPVAQHLVNSQNEFFRAIRAVIDKQIEWNDRHLKNAKEMRARRRRQRGAEAEE